MTANKERKKKSGAAEIFSRPAPEMPACPRGEGKDKRAVAAFNAVPGTMFPAAGSRNCLEPYSGWRVFKLCNAGALAPHATETVTEFGRFPWCA